MMGALLTLASLKANERSSDWSRCAGADELDLKGRPRNHPFLQTELSKSECGSWGIMIKIFKEALRLWIAEV